MWRALVPDRGEVKAPILCLPLAYDEVLMSDAFQPYLPPKSPAEPKSRLHTALRLILKTIFFISSFATVLGFVTLVMVSQVSPDNLSLKFFALTFFETLLTGVFSSLSYIKFRLDPERDDISTPYLFMDLALVFVVVAIFTATPH